MPATLSDIRFSVASVRPELLPTRHASLVSKDALTPLLDEKPDPATLLVDVGVRQRCSVITGGRFSR